MRKSVAPSRGLSSPRPSGDSASIPGAVRSTSDLLSILKKQHVLVAEDKENTSHIGVLKNESVSNDTPIKDNCQVTSKHTIFNVVWGKQTKKKHKTWEGDGILEVVNNSATLKDMDGHILGRSNNLKQPRLEEGSCVYVGMKEVQIIDRVGYVKHNDEDNENTTTTNNNVKTDAILVHPKKKVKLNSKGFVCPVLSCNETKDKFETLLMPFPSNTHQWECNQDKKPVTKVELDAFLTRVLRSHQKEGVAFLYSCISGLNNLNHTGAILADEMGLGKTLQCISLIWMCLKCGPYGGIPLIKCVLIVTPSSLVNNWIKEFKKWIGFERLLPFAINKKQKPLNYKNGVSVKSPVMIISYEMLVRHYADMEKFKFDLIICDEGHRLKNSAVRAFVLLNKINCKRRIILTGTPVQNNLQEFFTLIDFVNPGIFGSQSEFREHYEEPILLSHQLDCTEDEQQLAEERAKELQHRTNAFILRRTQQVINQYLPSKQDIVLFCSPSPLQAEMYEETVTYWEKNLVYKDYGCGSNGNLHLSVVMALKKICNHPVLLKNSYDTSADDPELFDDDIKEFLKLKVKRQESELNLTLVEHSGKMYVIRGLLNELKLLREKVIIVSYYTQTLNLLEKLCTDESYKYVRLDGSTPVSTRMEIVDRFNSPQSDHFVFLLSAKAGGIGLNLTGASRLVLFDLDWNPASDLQAMSRIWRDGQKKHVYIYRLLTTGTIEEKMYQRQISKTCLSNAVIDIQNMSDLRLSREQLKDLFEFKTDINSTTHDMLNCNCDGIGIPESEFLDECGDEHKEVSGQLLIGRNVDTDGKALLRINQLMEWEHYFYPYDQEILKELCLLSVSGSVSLMFRNKSVKQIE